MIFSTVADRNKIGTLPSTIPKCSKRWNLNVRPWAMELSQALDCIFPTKALESDLISRADPHYFSHLQNEYNCFKEETPSAEYQDSEHHKLPSCHSGTRS